MFCCLCDPGEARSHFWIVFSNFFPVLGTVLFLFKCYYRYWNSALHSYTTSPCRGEGKDIRRDAASSSANPMQRRAFGARALGGEGTLRTSPQVWEAVRLPSEPYRAERGCSIWEWLGETSHRRVIKNADRETADFIQKSRDGNMYKQAYHSLETGMQVHCICLDYSGQGCAQNQPTLGEGNLRPRVPVWPHTPAN